MKKFKFNKISIIVLAVMLILGSVGTASVFAFSNPATVNLGSAGNFTILSKTAISNTGATSITGDVGISPAAASYLTGFSQTMDSSNKFSTSTYVTGKLYASDYTAPTPSYNGTAVSAMEAAYTDATGRSVDELNRLGGTLPTGNTFTAGVYKWGSNVNITGDITLTGSATDVFIFQITGNLDIASGKKIILGGAVVPANIFWAVAGTTTLETTSTFEGNILGGPGASTIAMQTGSILHGKALGQTDVTLDAVTITSAGGTVPHLTVTKVVVNNNGRNSVVSDFPLFVGATSVVSGASNTFASGTYAITETYDPSYYAQSFSGDCNASGSITLFPGDNLTCTITNDDIAAVSQSSGGSAIIYGCKDPTATNYNYFSSSKPELCTYATTISSVVTPTQVVTTTTVTTPTIVPKLPKTGFPPQNNKPWYLTLFSDILNLIK